MKVKHPDIEGVERDVPEADVDSWVEQGWIAEKSAKKTSDPK